MTIIIMIYNNNNNNNVEFRFIILYKIHLFIVGY